MCALTLKDTSAPPPPCNIGLILFSHVAGHPHPGLSWQVGVNLVQGSTHTGRQIKPLQLLQLLNCEIIVWKDLLCFILSVSVFSSAGSHKLKVLVPRIGTVVHQASTCTSVTLKSWLFIISSALLQEAKARAQAILQADRVSRHFPNDFSHHPPFCARKLGNTLKTLLTGQVVQFTNKMNHKSHKELETNTMYVKSKTHLVNYVVPIKPLDTLRPVTKEQSWPLRPSGSLGCLSKRWGVWNHLADHNIFLILHLKNKLIT